MSHWVSQATFLPPQNGAVNPRGRHVLFLNNSFSIPQMPSEVCPRTLCCALSQASSISLIPPKSLCCNVSPVLLFMQPWTRETGLVHTHVCTHTKHAFHRQFWEHKWAPRRKFPWIKLISTPRWGSPRHPHRSYAKKDLMASAGSGCTKANL